MDERVVSADRLVKRFGDFTAVAGISFSVGRGEIFGFLGPNGSGKTTTIRMMLGLLEPTSGSVTVLGVRVTDQPERIRPRIGYMSQRFSLYQDLTVKENLQFYGRAYGLTNQRLRQQMNSALELAGLAGREAVRTRDLAGGWRQRLALGAAILHDPELIFLDEPTAGVDPVSRREFWDLLDRLAAGGVSIFVTTHYMDEAEHCHRLAFIQRGRLIAVGSPDEIKQDMMAGIVLEILTGDARRTLEILRDAQTNGRLAADSIELHGSQVHVVCADSETQSREITAALDRVGLRLQGINVVAPSLEDVFIACMR